MTDRPEYSRKGDWRWTRNGWTSANRTDSTPPSDENSPDPRFVVVRQGGRTLRITLGGDEPLIEEVKPKK